MHYFNIVIHFFFEIFKRARKAFMSNITLDDGGSGFTFNLNKLTAVGIEGDTLVLVIKGMGEIRLPMTQKNYNFFISQMAVYSNLAIAAAHLGSAVISSNPSI